MLVLGERGCVCICVCVYTYMYVHILCYRHLTIIAVYGGQVLLVTAPIDLLVTCHYVMTTLDLVISL